MLIEAASCISHLFLCLLGFLRDRGDSFASRHLQHLQALNGPIEGASDIRHADIPLGGSNIGCSDRWCCHCTASFRHGIYCWHWSRRCSRHRAFSRSACFSSCASPFGLWASLIAAGSLASAWVLVFMATVSLVRRSMACRIIRDMQSTVNVINGLTMCVRPWHLVGILRSTGTQAPHDRSAHHLALPPLEPDLHWLSATSLVTLRSAASPRSSLLRLRLSS